MFAVTSTVLPLQRSHPDSRIQTSPIEIDRERQAAMNATVVEDCYRDLNQVSYTIDEENKSFLIDDIWNFDMKVGDQKSVV